MENLQSLLKNNISQKTIDTNETINPPVTPSIIESKININDKIVNNNNELGKIRNSLLQYKKDPDYPENKFNYDDKNNEEVMLNSLKASTVLSDSYKLLNISEDSSKKAKYINDERKALEEAVSNNIVLANMLASQRQTPLLNTKERISEINNDNFREKEILVNRLIYIIYFIIFSIGLGISFELVRSYLYH